MTEEFCIGIDLGTTYSCMAFVDDDGQPVVDKNFEQEDTTPSVILFNENGEIIVGSPAKDMSIMYPPERTVTAVKRKMGTDFSIIVDDNKYTPVTLSATILKKMINDFNDNHACDVKKAVITCPAYFGHEEREDTKLAGKVAGLEDVSIINEPTAAAISFGFGRDGDEKKRVMVYDLGGGTFDVTILEIDGRSFTAVATDGERLLGGKDWDEALTKIIIRKISEQSGIEEEDIEADGDVMQTLELDSETLKKRLSTAESTKGTLSVGGKKVIYTVTRAEFDAATKPLIQTTIDTINRAMTSKGFQEGDIDSILLVGGSSRMPQVRENITAAFPDTKVEVYDPDQSVAKGAALYCKYSVPMQGTEEEKAEEPVAEEPAPVVADMTQQDESEQDEVPEEPAPAVEEPVAEEPAPVVDSGEAAVAEAVPEPPKADAKAITVRNILSKSFGIRASGEDKKVYISNIIFRNEVLPITAVKTYYPMDDGQPSIRVQIYENDSFNDEKGKKASIADGNSVGEFQMDLPAGTTRDTPITVRFIATTEGILKSTVDCMDVHKDYELTSPLKMSQEEFAESQGLMEKVAH